MGERMTLIRSDRYGDLHVAEEQIYRFEKGIVGWQDIKQYALIGVEDTPFFILHAVDEQLSFILIPAEKVVLDYGFEIDDETVELLDAKKPEDVVIFLIVNIIDDAFYVNLKAPVLLVPRSRAGCQYVIHDRDYPLRFPLRRREEAGNAGP
ncbi:MAG TPA: flagellar assembly protein FliW [Paenibacillaceae bacterium]